MGVVLGAPLCYPLSSLSLHPYLEHFVKRSYWYMKRLKKLTMLYLKFPPSAKKKAQLILWICKIWLYTPNVY